MDEMDFDEVWQDDEEMPAEMPGFEDDAKDDVGVQRRNILSCNTFPLFFLPLV